MSERDDRDEASLFFPRGAEARCVLLSPDADAETIASSPEARVVLLAAPDDGVRNPFGRVRALRTAGVCAFLLQLPLDDGGKGLVDVVFDASFLAHAGGWRRVENSPKDAERAAEFRDLVFEMISGLSDELAEAMLMGRAAPATVILPALRAAMDGGLVLPVLLAATSDGVACPATLELLAALR